MKKEAKDRTKQNMFLAQIERCIKAFEDADNIFDETMEMCNTIPIDKSNIDYERSDYLHILENYELDEESKVQLLAKLDDVLERRRNIYNIDCLVAVWRAHCNKVRQKENRVFLRQSISNRLSDLDCDYKFRILTEEDVNNIVNHTTKKARGRRAGSKNMTEDTKQNIMNEILKGRDPMKIAVEFGVSRQTVYHLRKKSEKLQNA